MAEINTLTTRRLHLRPFSADDAPAFHKIFKNPLTMQYWSTPPHRDLDETKRLITRYIECRETGESDEFVIEHSAFIIGKVGLWKSRWIGYIFAPEYWGFGFAHEALSALIDRTFSRGITIIDADVDPRNARSLVLLKRLGFKKSHKRRNTMKVGDVWVDSVYLALRRK